MNRRTWALLTAAVLFGLFALTCFFYRELNFVDVNSGRIRRETYVLHWLLSSSIDETAYSRLVTGACGGSQPAHWEQTEQFSLFRRVSPHYRYHGAEQALESVMKAIDVAIVAAGEEREVACKALELLKEGRITKIDSLAEEMVSSSRRDR